MALEERLLLETMRVGTDLTLPCHDERHRSRINRVITRLHKQGRRYTARLYGDRLLVWRFS